MKGGTLFSALQRLRNASVSILPTEALLRIAQHVTNGLAYLHASSFSFGDLKSMNVLLSELPDLDAGTFPPFTQAKLCDFGLSRNLKHVAESAPHSTTSNHTSDVCSTPPPSRGPAGTFAYLAPEAFSGLPTANAAAAKAADVYALGIVLWELATLQRPWPYKQALQLIRLVRKEGRRPEWPVEVIAGLPKGYVSLAERCWHQNAGCRPVVDEVARELEQMYTQTDVDDVPLWAAFGRGSGISATSSGVVDGDMSGDLDAVRVDDDGEGVDVSRECYVKEIRELDCNELNVSHSEMSEVTTVHGGGRLSQSRLSVDSFTPDADCGEVENVKYEMTKMNDSEGKEQRDDRNEQDEQDGQDDHVQEREYKVPMCKQDCAGLDNELRILEARDNLDVDDVGVCMFSRPHFR